jgi:hypothetical protein
MTNRIDTQGPGRPRLYPGETAAERTGSARAALRARGGRLAQVAMEPEDLAALARLRAAGDHSTDSAAIVAAIHMAARMVSKS